MFSFFRKNAKKEGGGGAAAVDSGSAQSNKRPADTCAAPLPAATTAAVAADQNSAASERGGHSTAGPASEHTSTMAPMAASRGKGKGKRKAPYHTDNNNKNQSQQPKAPAKQSQPQQPAKQPENVVQAPEKSVEPVAPVRHAPLSYAKILRRLEAVAPPQPAEPAAPERRHSVKPCSHVTVAAAPRATPPGSPRATPRNPDTLTAAIKLRIDLPAAAVKQTPNERDNDDAQLTNSASDSATNCATETPPPSAPTGAKPSAAADEEEKRNLVNQETRFQAQVSELSERLRARDAEATELHSQMEGLQQDLYAKTSGLDRLQAELAAAHKDSEMVRQKLKHLQDEIHEYKQKNVEMVDELQKKAEEYKALEASSKERTVKLEASVGELSGQLAGIREERDRLAAEREEEKRIVQEALDAAGEEKASLERRWQQDFERLRTVNTDREQQMLDDFEWKLREVQAACKRRLEERARAAEEATRQAEQQLAEVQHLRSYEAEVTQLRGLTHDQQRSLRSMCGRVDELQAGEAALREEVARLQAAVELERREQAALARRHDKELADRERALQIRLEQQTGAVAVQWEQKLRQECARLQSELEQLHGDEKQLAVELVRVQRDREHAAERDQWTRTVQQHLATIADLKATLAKKEDKFQTELDRMQTNTDRDMVELRRELDKAEMGYHERVEKMLEEHEQELDRLNEEAERRVKELEQSCQMQVSSMRATQELVKEQAAREAEERVQRLSEEHARALEELRQRLTEERRRELERAEVECKGQVTAAHKAHQDKEAEWAATAAALRAALDERDARLERLQGNVDTLHGGVHVLRQEIVHQDQALARAHNHAQQKIGELQHALKAQHDALQAEREEHIEQVTHMQKQSQAAMEQLQRRCQCLTKLFEDMRARYEKRESRPEDLNRIADLQAVVAEQERDLALLTEQTRYFQLELMRQRTPSDTPPRTKPPDNTLPGCSTAMNSPLAS